MGTNQRRQAWGKRDASGDSHHLVHHSADVAAVFTTLIRLPMFRRAAEASAGASLTKGQLARLTALAFLHDVGKLAPAFQARGWPEEYRRGRTTDHITAAFKWIETLRDRRETALAGVIPVLERWGHPVDWLRIAFSHHGRPAAKAHDRAAFDSVECYDWRAEEAILGRALLDWIPEAFTGIEILPAAPAFGHFVAGLLALADWVGSDRAAFRFKAEFDPEYWPATLARAAQHLKAIGLDAGHRQFARPPGFELFLPGAEPLPAQAAVGSADTGARLMILEAETGSGKTEAALWRYAALRAAGVVEGLYFALPTRSAARQLHGRVGKALHRMFQDPPEAVLAIPGMLASGDAKGSRLADWKVLWDDDAGAAQPARWAAEHATRFLAAEVAVGTVDQAMRAALMVKHAHMRGAALARSLLVIDEVHASDAYMRQIQTELLRAHLGLGGHALLMSATLGAVARAEWLGTPMPDEKEAQAVPYPAIWLEGRRMPLSPGGGKRSRRVAVAAHRGWDGAAASRLSLDAARQGARVLVIRNTVGRAVESWEAAVSEVPDLVLQLAGGPALHHGRFAAEDRAALDTTVEAVLGRDAPRTSGVVVFGTQTLEQSLDIDADLLITDLCPMDVLLQRIGRLHRHDRPRPEGFRQPRVQVLTPAKGLEPLLTKAENGLGAYSGDGTLSGIYVDVPGLAATLEQIETTPVWEIPAMNRALVEAATHPQALDRLASARGRNWQDYQRRVIGRSVAEAMGARRVTLCRDQPFPDAFPSEEKISTRLGEDGALVELKDGPTGPFGWSITRIALPAQWSRGLTGEEVATAEPDAGDLMLTVGEKRFRYGRAGLGRY